MTASNVRSELEAMLAAAQELTGEGIPARDLEGEYRRLSELYLTGRRTPRDISPTALAAYAAVRLPATLGANVEALRQVRLVRSQWEPRSMLDVGAGLGSAAWAAAATFSSIINITLREDSAGMAAAGAALAAASPNEPIRGGRWSDGDCQNGLQPADLVVASYVLGEVRALPAAVDAWWAATSDTLVIVEPGTPAGFERVVRARSQLIDLGASICAPCPHARECPLAVSEGWCHFGVRISRSRTHRAAKQGTLGSEDEKFSYVAATRVSAGCVDQRIIRRPSKRGGHVRFELCATAGLSEAVITRSNPAYRRATKLGWGDSLDDPS